MADRDFYRGVAAALAVVYTVDQPGIYDEIVQSVDEKELINQARKDGAMKWTGLYDYQKRQSETR